ncbi:hypothetical protein JD844_019238 [Phrynosoma platyrhinos]|uniref:Ig-like domain-containing protein n=1 Tax=Phrynosoma platyrhinos TaxID=52577 RepID=A0ABQ7SPJ8_PHRPL|nr:hypothetical protein JD844_019238 [Phrynosoma platyrhinos]
MLEASFTGKRLEIIQTPGSLLVSAGEKLTLHCTLRGFNRLGNVKWHKDLNRNQPAVYSQKGDSLPQVTRVNPGSFFDFSITIRNVQLEDAGTYYCVKYRYRLRGPEIEETSGKGTVVSVIGPTSRVESGASVTFKCTSDRFSPRDIAVTWWKDGRPIQPLQTTVLPEGESISYKVLSTVELQLTKEDVKSQLVCQINHKTLRSPLKESFRFRNILRVRPNIRMETIPPPPIQLNNIVTVTCNVDNFYPNDTTVAWLENNSKSEIRKDESMTQNRDGTSSLKSSLAMKATEERNFSVFACLIRHNSQPPVNKTATLIIRPQTEGGESANIPGAGTEDRVVIQPQDVVTVLRGDSLNLECQVANRFRLGSMKWFLGNGPNQKLIYDDTLESWRVTRINKSSDTDFTIVIHNVTDKDAGTYYCVMEYGFASKGGPECESGGGTQVIVQSIENQVVVQPQDFVSVITGESLKLKCWVDGGPPSGPMKWFLGNGTDRKVIYDDTLASERVTRNDKSSATDFTIVIHNVTDKDAGMYYCGMEKRFKGNGGADWKMGPGTQVAVKSAELRNSIPIGLWIGLSLSKIITALFLLFLFLRKEHSKMAPGHTAGSAGFSRAA